jgi:hypothetical protein
VPTAIPRRLLPLHASISATLRHGQSRCPTKTSYVSLLRLSVRRNWLSNFRALEPGFAMCEELMRLATRACLMNHNAS